MYCKKCGEYLPEHAKFCIACGAKINNNANKKSQTEYDDLEYDEGSSTKKSRGATAVLTVFALIFVIGAAILGYMYFNDSKSNSVKAEAYVADLLSDLMKDGGATAANAMTNEYIDSLMNDADIDVDSRAELIEYLDGVVDDFKDKYVSRRDNDNFYDSIGTIQIIGAHEYDSAYKSKFLNKVENALGENIESTVHSIVGVDVLCSRYEPTDPEYVDNRYKGTIMTIVVGDTDEGLKVLDITFTDENESIVGNYAAHNG